MGVTVGVLVLLMFTIQGMGLFDRLVQRRQSATALLDAPSNAVIAPETREGDSPPVETARETIPGGETVAAIAVALALAEDESQVRQVLNNPPPGTSPDAWVQAGRRYLMNQRGRPSR
jgi:Na+-transporting methylmalonyl-CoA/oxaloacetate decarboxylase gamma subunit